MFRFRKINANNYVISTLILIISSIIIIILSRLIPAEGIFYYILDFSSVSIIFLLNIFCLRFSYRPNQLWEIVLSFKYIQFEIYSLMMFLLYYSIKIIIIFLSMGLSSENRFRFILRYFSKLFKNPTFDTWFLYEILVWCILIIFYMLYPFLKVVFKKIADINKVS